MNLSAVLVVEDSPAGVRAGKAAGCTVVGLTTTHPAEALRDADTCVSTLSAIRDLPAAPSRAPASET